MIITGPQKNCNKSIMQKCDQRADRTRVRTLTASQFSWFPL